MKKRSIDCFSYFYCSSKEEKKKKSVLRPLPPAGNIISHWKKHRESVKLDCSYLWSKASKENKAQQALVTVFKKKYLLKLQKIKQKFSQLLGTLFLTKNSIWIVKLDWLYNFKKICYISYVTNYFVYLVLDSLY